jgi:arylsulfatase A-like enzyme
VKPPGRPASKTNQPKAIPVAVAEQSAKPWPSKPNILFVVLDTVRFDATQLDSKSTNKTPFLKGLLDSGVNFRTAYSTRDATPFSHFSLLTGYIDGFQTPIDRPESGLPYQLIRIGYRAFGVVAAGPLSKTQFRPVLPIARYTALMDVYEASTPEQKSAAAKEIDPLLRLYNAEPNDWYSKVLYATSGRVLNQLHRELARVKSPFFGLVNFFDAHDPYFPNPRMYDEGKTAGEVYDPRYRKLSEELAHPENIADPARKQLVLSAIEKAGGRPWSTTLDLDRHAMAIYRSRYRAEIRSLDRAVSQVFAMLDEFHLRDSTIVIITADHGEALGEQQAITHWFLERGDREATHHVPLLIVFPREYGMHGISIKTMVTGADIAPTLYDLVGIDSNPLARLTQPGNYGHSLLPLLKLRSAERATLAATTPPPTLTPAERATQDSEALKNFRSLGYIH